MVANKLLVTMDFIQQAKTKYYLNRMNEDINLITEENLRQFFSQPAIKLTGFCRECDLSQPYIHRVIYGNSPLNKQQIAKMKPYLSKYNFYGMAKKGFK